MSALVVLWPILISGVSRIYPGPEVRTAASVSATTTDQSLASVLNLDRIKAVDAIASAAEAAVGAAVTADPTLTDPLDKAPAAFSGAATVAVAASANSSVWKSALVDCASLEQGRDPFREPLWSQAIPADFAELWAATRKQWSAAGGPVWAFWIRWYENALEGRPQDWPLLRDIALIPAEDWQGGPDRVHPIIERMLLARERIPVGPIVSSSAIQEAVKQNLAALPPTFDAIECLLVQEVERLQTVNYRDDKHLEDAKRLISVFRAMHAAVTELRGLVPTTGAPDEKTAEKMKSLLETYRDEYVKWPRDNAADLVDGTYRIVLVGASTGLLVMLGTPVAAAASLAGLFFGGKKLAEIGKFVASSTQKSP